MALSKQNVGQTKLETPAQTIPIYKEPVVPISEETGMPKNGNGNAGFTLNRNLLIVGILLFFLLGMD